MHRSFSCFSASLTRRSSFDSAPSPTATHLRTLHSSILPLGFIEDLSLWGILNTDIVSLRDQRGQSRGPMNGPMPGPSNNMATYQQLQREPASKDLFNNRIARLQGLRNALKDSAFLAIDTEHVAITSEKDRMLHQVGLACFPAPAPDSPTSPNTDRPNLQDFYNEAT